MADWLTIGEISKQTGIPETSIRRYAKVFDMYIPGKKIGRAYKYIPDAAQVIEKISSAYQEGHSTEEIFEILRHSVPRVIEAEEENHHITTTPPPQVPLKENQLVMTEALKQIAIVVSKHMALDQKLSDQNKKMEIISREQDTQSDEIVHLRNMIEAGSNASDPRYDNVLSMLKQIDRNRIKDREIRDKVLIEQKGIIARQGKELEEIRQELARMKKPLWKRLFNRFLKLL